ncbi:hypothetical protein RUM43_007026 [Polyplax serrata]|uniref:Delta-like protein n=1 Tax=Polyplax serrata TaxID=468196 RepID=A0AAN8Q5L1_POLSC
MCPRSRDGQPTGVSSEEGKFHRKSVRKVTANPNRGFPYRLEFKFPRSFTLILQAVDFNNYTVPATHEIIEETNFSGIIDPSVEWHLLNHPGQTAQLTYRIRVQCDVYHFNQTCTKFCKPRDDNFGHYICDRNGDKKCIEGWKGPNCDIGELPPVRQTLLYDVRKAEQILPFDNKMFTGLIYFIIIYIVCEHLSKLYVRLDAILSMANAISPATASKHAFFLFNFKWTGDQVVVWAGEESFVTSVHRIRDASMGIATEHPGSASVTPTGEAYCVTKVSSIRFFFSFKFTTGDESNSDRNASNVVLHV